MRSRPIGRRLWRHLWIPVVLTTAAMAGAAAVVGQAVPQYAATATVVAKSPAGLDKPLSFADIATSNSVLLEVKKQLSLSESVDSLAGRIQVTSGRSQLYTVTVRDTDPARATRIANAVSTQAAALYQQLGAGTTTSLTKDLEKNQSSYQQQYAAAAKALAEFNRQHPEAVNPTNPALVNSDIAAQEMLLQLDARAASEAYLQFRQRVTQAQVDQLTNQQGFSATVVDQAAAKPDDSRRYLDVAYAGAVGLIVGAALVLLLQLRDKSVREVAEIEELIGAPVIATIPHAGGGRLRSKTG